MQEEEQEDRKKKSFLFLPSPYFSLSLPDRNLGSRGRSTIPCLDGSIVCALNLALRGLLSAL